MSANKREPGRRAMLDIFQLRTAFRREEKKKGRGNADFLIPEGKGEEAEIRLLREHPSSSEKEKGLLSLLQFRGGPLPLATKG